MADLPFPIDAREIQELINQFMRLAEDMYQERLGGAVVGDVFQIGDDDVFQINIGDGLEKSSSELIVSLSTTGGLQFVSGKIAVKAKSGGGIATDVDGVYVSGTQFYNFKTIACPAGTNPVADQTEDTLTLTAGTGITITGDSATDTITIENSTSHAAVTVSSPISMTGQALSLVNNAGSPETVTAIDVGALANSDTVVPTSKAVTTALHSAVTVSAPISVTGQALSLVNDATATVTEIDTGALANVDTKIPTSKAVTTAIAASAVTVYEPVVESSTDPPTLVFADSDIVMVQMAA